MRIYSKNTLIIWIKKKVEFFLILAFESDDYQKECTIEFQDEEIHEKPKFSLFKEIDLNKKLQDNLLKMQFLKMTPIQKSVISYILQGKDVMGCAQTGSGKTIAFLLPIVNKMITQGPPDVSSKLLI